MSAPARAAALAAGMALLCSGGLRAGELRTPRPGAVDQRDYADSAKGCGPAALLNLLKFSGPDYAAAHLSLTGGSDAVKMRYVVDRYFLRRPSAVLPGTNRWGVHGLHAEDLAAGLNELLEEQGVRALASSYLDRRDGEGDAAHLARCHRWIEESLRREVAPVLSLRSFVVRRREEDDFEPVWESGVHHYVTITAVAHPPAASGFALTVLDPWGGAETEIHLHPEPAGQPFRAPKGAGGDDAWLSGRPFLLALAPGVPSLVPRRLDWSERFLVVANFLVGDF